MVDMSSIFILVVKNNCILFMSNNSRGLIIFGMLLSILLIIIGLQKITHSYNIPDVFQGRFEEQSTDFVFKVLVVFIEID